MATDFDIRSDELRKAPLRKAPLRKALLRKAPLPQAALPQAKPQDAESQDAEPRLEKRLRVVLINPPTLTAPRSLSYYGAVPPLGLAYVAAAIRDRHDVQVVDATGEALERSVPYPTTVGELRIHGLPDEAILARVGAAPDVIGLSHMFLHQWPWLRSFLAKLRDRFPDALLVLGGENATAFADSILAGGSADACVLGEGEATFRALLDAVALSRPLASIPGLALADQRTRGERISAIDALPRPAWDLFPVRAYFRARAQGGVDRGPGLPLLTSRGCPYRCSFCSSPEMWTTRYVRRDPEDVADEIAEWVERYRIENVDLHDLTAMLKKEWILGFCDALDRRNLRVSFQLPSGTRSEAIDEEVARRLYRSGCRNFCFAPESGSERTLRRIRKKVKIPRLRASLRGAVDAGLQTHANLIIGFPHESRADILKTCRLALTLADDGLHTLGLMIFAPYPGSEEYRALRDEGRLELDDKFFYSALLRAAGSVGGYHPELSHRALTSIQLATLLAFFARQYARRPSRALAPIRHLAAGRNESVLDQFLQKKLPALGTLPQWFRRKRAPA
ncbi:MAG: radical SAM protein [Myxococcota bacterium]